MQGNSLNKFLPEQMLEFIDSGEDLPPSKLNSDEINRRNLEIYFLINDSFSESYYSNQTRN